ncbi:MULTISPECIES: hypothetical protein [unclassified Okeania]|nr:MULTISPECIES: hypothetical protein [unclassified Okeania]NET23760.1 hypothetical protein [Okeania sp. SIO1H5]NET97569.1 hypothetical protein [Okeania sp. SIO1H2]
MLKKAKGGKCGECGEGGKAEKVGGIIVQEIFLPPSPHAFSLFEGLYHVR